MKKASYIVLLVTAVTILSLFLAPASSLSTNPCSICHSPYYQYLDIREGDSGNQLPATIGVGETKTVRVVVENLVNTATYQELAGVSLTLSSQNGHFSVKTPTYDMANLPMGTGNATWSITGTSAGEDALLISAEAVNPHQSVRFSDDYLPKPAITVVSNPGALSISLTSPINGENWVAGSTRNINWSASGGTGQLTITLHYSASGINGPWATIASGLQGNGSQTWTVPDTPSTSFYVRATVNDSAIPSNNASVTSSIEVSTTTVPEFPSTMFMAALLLMSAFSAVFFKKKTKKDEGRHASRIKPDFSARVLRKPNSIGVY